MTRILVVDNYDSFVHTIVGYLEQLGAECDIRRTDAVDADACVSYDGVLISPGPGSPESAGVSIDMILACAQENIPMLGVCLGHQALTVAYGGVVDRASELLHGKTSPVIHYGHSIFTGLPSPFTATRYHSLIAVEEELPDCLTVTARTESGTIMGISHRDKELHGVQFHPESILSEGGHRLIANWLSLCGQPDAVDRAAGLSPLVRRGAAANA
ncbi:aminodeoxychorismate synthase, glutamine amidotransferase subunit [Austwickia chelonae]|uniref:Putative glutamine amidotransferase n=1 Tax=Austwickia chelonae NBRC 105200 TaxID=1184607 RepID=K6VUU1_9MICO|nr:aminodeoxychorismate/anthranilate synthase component II [Austwickia chelonae]GAB79090.1 putative glutamine amidotransferase [Austwickia chelonae NBRC 105200]SEW42185.1 aminodeoxychorismate synthase, glutamine amidotransferase subunit [Austwickia chelonae]